MLNACEDSWRADALLRRMTQASINPSEVLPSLEFLSLRLSLLYYSQA